MVELPIRAFRLNGIDGYFEINITEVYGFPEKTDFDGGYSAKGNINLKANCYCVDYGVLWFSTGSLYRFFKQLNPCYEKISGNAVFMTTERDFELKVQFKDKGHVILIGIYKERPDVENKLYFEITSDQTQVLDALHDLKKIEDMFGDERGFGVKRG